MPSTASWVHGNNAAPQFVGGISVFSPGTDQHHTEQVGNQPWTDIVGLPQGPGKIFRGGPGDNFFHFTIPTPVILENVRITLERVFVLYRADPNVTVIDVSVFDGPNRVFVSAMPTGISGRHDGAGGLADLQDNITRWNVNPVQVFWGIGISVHVRFGGEGNITFTAAGADFAS